MENPAPNEPFESSSRLEGNPVEQHTLPETLPLLSVRDVVVFPYMILTLFVARDNSVAAVEAALARDQLVFLALQRDQNIEHPTTGNLFEVGAVGMIRRQLKLPDGRIKVLVQGLTRARVARWLKTKLYFKVGIEPLDEPEEVEITVPVEALMRNVHEASEKILSLRDLLSGDVLVILGSVEEPGHLANLVASNLRFKVDQSQAILEETDPVARLTLVHGHLGKELEVSTMQANIQSEAKKERTKTQREYYLREQLRAIRRELGDAEDRHQKPADLRQALTKKPLPEEARAEATIIRTYLDWILDLPWGRLTKDRLGIARARNILDEDHYDLQKVKDRILEYLAMRKLNPDMKGPILCLMGPPGVGKTPLGRSIARAMGRKFVRLSLDGAHNETEVRGHRRTCIGATPAASRMGSRPLAS